MEETVDSLRCFMKEQLEPKIDEHLTRLLLVVAAGGVVAVVCIVGAADDEQDEDDDVDVELLFVTALVAVVTEKVRPLAVDEAQLDNGVIAAPLSGMIALLVSTRGGVATWLAAAVCAPLAKEPIKVEVMLEVDREMVSLNSLRSINLLSRLGPEAVGDGCGGADKTAFADLSSLDLDGLLELLVLTDDLAVNELLLLLVDEESSWPRPLSNS